MGGDGQSGIRARSGGTSGNIEPTDSSRGSRHGFLIEGRPAVRPLRPGWTSIAVHGEDDAATSGVRKHNDVLDEFAPVPPSRDGKRGPSLNGERE
jgi:hypothetical protein